LLDDGHRAGAVPVDLREGEFAAGLRRAGIADGPDVAIDTSGRESARRGLLDALGARGALVCIGHGEGLRLSVTTDLISRERAVLGSEYFRFDELPANLELLLRHRDELTPIITHRVGIGELERAYGQFLAGETGKVVIEQ